MQLSYRLVFGASGYIGGYLVPYLTAPGHQVRATARNIEVLESREWQDVELARADALRPESLDDVLQDVDIAYYLVHSFAAGNRRYPASRRGTGDRNSGRYDYRPRIGSLGGNS
jgi:uncharacterized protein YbjT (DUF2867 family)